MEGNKCLCLNLRRSSNLTLKRTDLDPSASDLPVKVAQVRPKRPSPARKKHLLRTSVAIGPFLC